MLKLRCLIDVAESCGISMLYRHLNVKCLWPIFAASASWAFPRNLGLRYSSCHDTEPIIGSCQNP